jgi:hypothetical protein
VSKLEERIAALEAEVELLKAADTGNDNIVTQLDERVTDLEIGASAWAIFEPAADEAYQTVQSHLGSFPISLTSATANAGGSRVSFKVANLLSANVNRPTFRLRYGRKRQDSDPAGVTYHGDMLTKEYDFIGTRGDAPRATWSSSAPSTSRSMLAR